MKKSLLVLLTLFAFSAVAAETEKVCIKDEKTKKETCKVDRKSTRLNSSHT